LEFTEHRMRSGIKAKTVRDSDLSCLKALFGFAVAKGMLASHPAQGITIKVRQGPQKRRRKEFDDAEAQAILTHAWNYRPIDRRESPKLTAAKRWVPWLCAYSGTRVGEMAQLRKQDIKQENGTWIITISHEAGTQKRKATWSIPLHPHLIEMGFLEFVQAAEDGHLFLTPRPDRYRPDSPESRTKDPQGILGPLQGAKNRLREFVREVITRPDVQPNHGWRHRFKTVGRECRIEKIVLNAFANHEGADVSDDYGGVTMKTMLGALERMPRYEIAV
jgi:integrase